MSQVYVFSKYVKKYFILLLSFYASLLYSESLTDIKKKGLLTVCSQAGFMPFEMKSVNGKWQGFDIELMKDFSKSLDVTLKMIDVEMDGLIPSLIAQKCEIIASGFTITAEREKVVIFSTPIRDAYLSFATLKKSDNKSIKDYKFFLKGSKKIAVHVGTSSSLYAIKNINKERVLSYKTQADMISAVENGLAEAFLEDDFFVDIVNKKLKNKFDIYRTNNKTSIALAFRKNDKALKKAFDSFLKTWRAKGYYKKWSEYFFKKMLWMKEKSPSH